jgi:hypothetical protein
MYELYNIKTSLLEYATNIDFFKLLIDFKFSILRHNK